MAAHRSNLAQGLDTGSKRVCIQCKFLFVGANTMSAVRHKRSDAGSRILRFLACTKKTMCGALIEAGLLVAAATAGYAVLLYFFKMLWHVYIATYPCPKNHQRPGPESSGIFPEDERPGFPRVYGCRGDVQGTPHLKIPLPEPRDVR